ncbi:uncharacterized protein PAC_01565 [Phialocephala subalpina]|uniref:NAD(P)-binding protein n=1 Tax=Phialocephala subalpina TaxID=576137 RepID=A0A1L7WFZ3_9HELO|nr:uncharacterized protein PAC_01565 [Phialocephala subalpina]
MAFVTGGARGFGNAIAVAFSREGARGVAVIDINPQALTEGKKIVESFGTKCLAIEVDVTKEEDVERAVAEAVKDFGRIDYAASVHPSSSKYDQNRKLMGMTSQGISQHPLLSNPHIRHFTEDFRKGMVVNSTGVFLSTKHELRQMMKQDFIEVEEGRVPQRGAIFNSASVNSQMAIVGSMPYTASKYAVLGTTKAAALEARDYSIRVNAIFPGFLLTDLLKPIVGAVNGLPQEVWAGCEARQGRAAKFEEVWHVAVLITSPRMSLVNGVNLFVDGGFTINEA